MGTGSSKTETPPKPPQPSAPQKDPSGGAPGFTQIFRRDATTPLTHWMRTYDHLHSGDSHLSERDKENVVVAMSVLFVFACIAFTIGAWMVWRRRRRRGGIEDERRGMGARMGERDMGQEEKRVGFGK